VTCEKRNVTTVPTQALTLLNNEFVLLQARQLAERVAREAGDDPAKQIEQLYRITLGRQPARNELDSFLAFVQKQRGYHAAKVSSSGSDPSARGSADLAALSDLAHVMLNANEFVYIN
jgi:hypothetical protein